MAGNLLFALFLAIALCAAHAPAVAGPERVGNAAAVRGLVQLAAISGIRKVGKKVASGEPIYLGDRVTTGPNGRLQIMLLDETVFTIGPKAAIVIDEFVYDPRTSNGKVAATVLKGTFRFVTGKVSKKNPENMVVKLPVGSIGVRGTSVAGRVEGRSATVVLLGPGPNKKTGERVGRIIVSGSGVAGIGSTVEISRPGFATQITDGAPPTPPVRIDPVLLTLITGAVNEPPPPPPPPTESGEPTKDGAIEPGSTFFVGGGDFSQLPPPKPPPKFTDLGPNTTFEQLRSIPSGIADFGVQTVPIFGPGTGNYTIAFSYNFGTQTAAGTVSITTISGFSTIGSGSFPLLANPFATGTGPVNITESGINPSGALNTGVATITYKFRNSNNVIFKALDHQLTFTEGVSGSGGGVLVRP